MGYRRKSREYALQMLYQYDVIRQSAGLSEGFWADKEAPENIMEFADSIVDGNILRMSVFELFYIKDIPVKVTLNEAIEIAKRFGEEESGSFVNGILDRIVRDHQELLEDKL